MEQFMNVLVVALLSMSPNAPAGKSPVLVENWPVLTISEHLVEKTPSICGDAGDGCTVVSFGDNTCDIYIAWREPRKAAVRERELKRCRGYDDPPYRLKAAYAQWLASQSCKACPPAKEVEVRQRVVAARGETAVSPR